jgi:hypothetical protein
MGIGTSIFLVAVGAILRYAVTLSVAGVKLEVVGLILMIVGALGLVVSLIRSSMLARRRRATVYSDPRYLH